jgi:hypothetical protein
MLVLLARLAAADDDDGVYVAQGACKGAGFALTAPPAAAAAAEAGDNAPAMLPVLGVFVA